MLGGTKEFGNQTYSHCPQPTEWQLVAAAVSQSPPPPSLSAAPADLPPELGDHLQRVLVPPTKSVHKKRNEHNTLCLTPVAVLSHLDDKTVWDSTTSILQLFEQVLELIRNDKLQKRFLQFATKTDGLLQPFSKFTTILSKRTICTMHVRNN